MNTFSKIFTTIVFWLLLVPHYWAWTLLWYDYADVDEKGRLLNFNQVWYGNAFSFSWYVCMCLHFVLGLVLTIWCIATLCGETKKEETERRIY